jgi:hypothetical protein
MEILPVNFSKILITGKLNPSMPYIVLRELAFELGIIVSVDRLREDIKYWSKIFKMLIKLKPFTIVNYQQDQETLVNIVNPLCSWDVDSLKKALEHMIFFFFSFNLASKQVHKIEYAGIQSYEKICSYNACMLYSICRENNIFTPVDSSYEDLKILVEQFYKSVQEEDLSSINEKSNTSEISEDSKQDMGIPINLVSSEINIDLTIDDLRNSPKQVTKNYFDLYSETENLKSEANLLSDLNYVYNYVEPVNHIQAIVIGSLLFSKDFSKFQNPLCEFKRWKLNMEISHNEKLLKLVEKINPLFNDLNLYFNPYLPKNAYQNSILEHHISLFSFPTFEYENASSYEILQELHLEENFHIGYLPNILNSETPVLLEQIDTLENGDLVCFGVKEEFLQATTWKELKDIFSNMNMFINPFEKNRVFSKNQIERLYKIGRWILHNIHFSIHTKFKYLFENYSKSTIKDMNDCLDVIDQIKLFHEGNFSFLESLVIEFNNKSQPQKEEIICGIHKLFEITMYMRGWDGISENYPIQNAPYPSDQNAQEKRILENIYLLDEINHKTNNFIYKLPLMIWKNEFVQSVLEEQGITIGDRIKIVKSGESEGVYSCVRMSSNVIGSSYCFYCRIFNIPSKFDINLLIYIQ